MNTTQWIRLGDVVAVEGYTHLFKTLENKNHYHNGSKTWVSSFVIKSLKDGHIYQIDSSRLKKLTPHEIAEWKIKQQTR